ncbi:hypothetical protein SAMN05444158_2618 [Bradyrhizobium canariense]|uniref:Uncharacterized protein n=1 Tax=Bradyrhizobium canariense TaxID=255045 RepID=A0A1H1TN53_9BRAD|nr:hypothetical protein SAMN05444158_2618 [Bradyrhizobium canariense]
MRIGESRDSGFDASHRPGMTARRMVERSDTIYFVYESDGFHEGINPSYELSWDDQPGAESLQTCLTLSPRDAPELMQKLPPRGRGECRAPSAPAASCAHGVGKYAHEYSQQSHRKSPGIPARNGFNGLLRALPGDRALLPPSPRGPKVLSSPVEPNEPPQDLTPASRRQDHTTSPSADSVFDKSHQRDTVCRAEASAKAEKTASSSCVPDIAHGEQSALRPHRTPDAAASTASHPASVTIAIRPSCGTRRRRVWR